AAARLPACWPLHTALINRLSVCEELHRRGMAEGDIQAAQDYQRNVELALEAATQVGAECPQDSPLHRPPASAAAAEQPMRHCAALYGAYVLYLEAKQLLSAAHRSQEDAARAQQLREELRGLLGAGGVDNQVWEDFRRGER